MSHSNGVSHEAANKSTSCRTATVAGLGSMADSSMRPAVCSSTQASRFALASGSVVDSAVAS